MYKIETFKKLTLFLSALVLLYCVYISFCLALGKNTALLCSEPTQDKYIKLKQERPMRQRNTARPKFSYALFRLICSKHTDILPLNT